MGTYTKKFIAIQATRWFKNGDHPLDNCRTITPVPGDGEPFLSEGKVVRRYRHPRGDGADNCPFCRHKMHWHGWIDTMEGRHIVCPGDYVITGVKGEYYPCKPDIFEATYDPEWAGAEPAPSGKTDSEKTK